MFPQPSAPPLTDIIKENESATTTPTGTCNYNCEEGCDVEILVRKGDEDPMRFPVHSHKIAEYPYFKALLSEDFDVKYNSYDDGKRKLRELWVHRIDRKAFDNIMKFIYKESINLQQAPETTVETLKAAHQFLLPGLVRVCVKYLGNMISLNNVIFIFANVFYLCNDVDNLEEQIQSCIDMPFPKRRKHSILTSNSKNDQATTPSNANCTAAPQQDNHLSAGPEMKDLCVWLLCQCLTFIDIHAADVLRSDEIEELSYPYVKFLLERDSLDVSEIAIFSALTRWAETECKRKQLPLTCDSKRQVLHDLIYVVRYFQMPLYEFLSGPGESKLLSPDEVDIIKNVLLLAQSDSAFITSSKRNLGELAFCIEQIQNSDELLALKAHWKYMSQPRTPRLNNGGIGNNHTGSNNNTNANNGKKRRKYSLEGKPKKGLLKVKRIGLIIKNICVPRACRKDSAGQLPELHESTNILISNDLARSSIDGQQKTSGTSQQSTQSRRRSLQRSESKLSKAFDYSLRAFAFFFD